MAEITAQLVKKLKDTTSCGIMDCKNALVETNGNFEEAIALLRKKGIAKAESKADRTTAEGLISIFTEEKKASIIELNVETDFVARNEHFQNFSTNVTKIAYHCNGDLAAIMKAKYDETGKTVEDEIKANIAVIGENIQLRRAGIVKANNGLVVSYVHNSFGPNLGKIGVVISVEASPGIDLAQLKKYGHQLAMHIAATNPLALTSEEIPAHVIEYERNIYLAEAQASGSPANIVEKIVEGKLRKLYAEKVLLEQAFIMDTKITIKQFLAQISKELNSTITIGQYLRYKVGEGIEKPQTNFAEEVKAVLK